MIRSTFENIRIAGIAAAVPKNREILSERYNDLFGEESVRAFSKTTGVLERRVAKEEQTASDLAYVSAKHVIRENSVDKEKIGICIFISQTPDYRFPSTACVLHRRLELPKDCIAFDVNLGCSGYVYGIQIISSLLQSTNCRYGLLLAGDTLNKVISPQDKSSCMLFGDSGCATLFEKADRTAAIATAYRTDGRGFQAIITPSGGYRNPNGSHERVKWADGNERSDYELYMNGVEVFSFTISEVPAMINEFMEESRIGRDSFDAYVLHQANCYILKQVAKRSRLPKDKLPISMDRYGNTSVTSIPLTLCDRYGALNEDGEKRILSCGFGVGLSWGIAAFTVNQKEILPIVETDDFFKEGAVSHD